MRRATLLISLAIVVANASYAAEPPISIKDARATEWYITTLDAVETALSVHYSYTSMALDQDGDVHISYRGTEYDLRYATKEDGHWQTEVVEDASNAVARENAIAIDAAGQPHISYSYRDGGSEELKYAVKGADGTWAVSTVFTDDAGIESAITLDSNGDVHVSHYEQDEEDLLYSTNQSGDWVTDILADASWDRTAIAVDSDGFYQIVYKNGTSLIHIDAFGIQTLIDPAAPGPSAPTLVLDGDDALHVSYSDGDHLKYATNALGFWQVDLVAADTNSDRDHSMALDADAHAHISYRDLATRSLVYAENTSGSWSATPVDSAGDVGYSNSITVDDDNVVRISYRFNEFPKADYNDIWGFSSELFAVADDGVIVRYDGASWHVPSSETTHDLEAVWGSSPTDIYAVGYPSTILQYDGMSWAEMDSGTSFITFYGVWGTSPFDIFVVGSSGTILHYDGTSWNEMISGTTTSLYQIWGSSPLDVYAVGSSGTIMHYDGNTWSPMISGTTSSLYGIWGHSPLEIFVAGSSGTILSYDGGTWTEMESGTTSSLYDVHGSSPSNVYAAGSSGKIVHYDGISWDSVISPTSSSIYGIWTNSVAEAFAVGVSQILHFDVGGWNPMDRSELRYATNEPCGGDVSACTIFSDGFESGDVSAWSQTIP